MVLPPLSGAAAPTPLGCRTLRGGISTFTGGCGGLTTKGRTGLRAGKGIPVRTLGSGVNARRNQPRLTVRARAHNMSNNNNPSSHRECSNRGGREGGGGGGDALIAALRGAASGVIVTVAAASCLLLGGPSIDTTKKVSMFAGTAAVSVGVGVPAAYADDDVDGRAEAAFTAQAESSSSSGPEGSSSVSSDVQIVDEVWKVVDDNFLPARSDSGFNRAAWAKLREQYLASPPASRSEAYSTIRDMLHTLGDPFSRFVDPADFAPLLKYDISGVGLNIAEDVEDPTRLKVLGLVLDSPAARAGIKQGDELVAVDGESVRNRSAFQAVSLIQAAPGPDVRVTVRQQVAGSSGSGRDGGGFIGGKNVVGDEENNKGLDGVMSSSSSSSSGGDTSSSTKESVLTLRRSSSASNPVSARMESGSVGYIRLKVGGLPSVARRTGVASYRAPIVRSHAWLQTNCMHLLSL